MASAEGGLLPIEVGYGEVPSQPTESLGERRELPQRNPGESPCRKRILVYFGYPLICPGVHLSGSFFPRSIGLGLGLGSVGLVGLVG